MSDFYFAGLHAGRLPFGIIIDEAWSWTDKECDEHGVERQWFHPERLGDFKLHNFQPEDAGIRTAHAAGLKYVLHISPFIGCRSEYAQELLANGYLVMRASEPSLPLMGQYHHYFMDFTNPQAVTWWQRKIRRLLELGADGFFADFAESDDQRDALYFRGTGATRGQEYSLLMRQALSEVLREKRGEDYFFISRPGWAGMQQYAGALIGDQPGTFEGMALVLSAMQSLAMSGQSVAAHNLGGYTAGQEKTVYLRWVQMGIVSPFFVMWNGGTTGEPWTFDEETVALFRESAELRMRLLPYLHSCLAEFSETGLPLVRPMPLLFPDRPEVAARQDQFMCGSELLAAPIFSANGRRSVFLPAGDWLDFWTGAPLTGGREIQVEHPLATFPLFVRRGGIVPIEISPTRPAPQQDGIELRLYGLGENSFRLHDQGRVCAVRTQLSEYLFEVLLEPLERPFSRLRIYGAALPAAIRLRHLSGQEESLAAQPDGATWIVRVPASGGHVFIQVVPDSIKAPLGDGLCR